MRHFTRSELEERRTEPTNDDSLGVINVIVDGLNIHKGKNNRRPEDVLSIEKDPWVKQEVTFGSNNKVIGLPHNDSLVMNVRLNRYKVK